MAPIIDFHVHVMPDPVAKLAPRLSYGPLAQFRKRARQWMKPIATTFHRAQTVLRHLPQPARDALDGLAGLAPLPGLLFESTASDLRDAMSEAGVDHALVIAHPPLISNEDVLEICFENPRLIPVVNVSAGTHRPSQQLKKYVERGAKALKIHPAADGEGPGSPHYRALLKTASELGLPVILHTGCLHTHILYKDPGMGDARKFEPWFKAFPETRFILAHMNFHEPGVALDLAEENPNVYVDTSWQPAEMVGEAVRRIGAERVLFGTDWPFMGNNLSVGLGRVYECVDAGTLKPDDAKLILGENAVKLLGLN